MNAFSTLQIYGHVHAPYIYMWFCIVKAKSQPYTLVSIPQAQSSTSVSLKGSRPSRRPNSVAGTPHMRRSKSVIHPRDLMSLEVNLAKQTRKLQKLKSQDTPADTLQREKEILKRLQDDLARGMMHHSFRQQKGGVSRWFMTRSHEAGDTPPGGSMSQKISQAVKKQLFNQQGLFSLGRGLMILHVYI